MRCALPASTSSHQPQLALAWAFEPAGFNPAGWHAGVLQGGQRVLLRGPLNAGHVVWARAGHGRPWPVRFIGMRIRPELGVEASPSALRAPLPSSGWRLSSRFGLRKAPAGKDKGQTRHHNGLDLAAVEGTPIYAAASGVVADQWTAGVGKGVVNGNGVRLEHELPDVRATAYLHMSAVSVKQGERVTAGQRIGLVGKTGQATGAHLHWIVYGPSGPVDPLPFLEAARQPTTLARVTSGTGRTWTVLLAVAGASTLAGLLLWRKRQRAQVSAPMLLLANPHGNRSRSRP